MGWRGVTWIIIIAFLILHIHSMAYFGCQFLSPPRPDVPDILPWNPWYENPWYDMILLKHRKSYSTWSSGWHFLDLISTISDPEHPLSLGQLAVVNLPDIHITPSPSAGADPNTLTRVLVEITPTITHCSLATVIGLGVRVRLEQALPPNYRVDIVIKEGTHSQDDQVNKQLADKERVAAALENDTLRGVLDKMLETCLWKYIS